MNYFFSLLAFSSGIFLSFGANVSDPLSLGLPVASIAFGSYFLLTDYLASESGSFGSSLIKTVIRLSFCLVTLYCLLSVVSPFKKDRTLARQKSCLANLRLIGYAIQDYNTTASGPNKISSMEMKDVASGGFLIKSGILQSEIIGLTEKCLYHGSDLTGTGTIICDFHGSVDHPTELPESQPNYPKAIAGLAGIFFFLMALTYLPFVMIWQMFGFGSPEKRPEN